MGPTEAMSEKKKKKKEKSNAGAEQLSD